MSDIKDKLGNLFKDSNNTGELTKLKIIAFEKPEQDGIEAADFGIKKYEKDQVFEAFFNPSSFSITHGISYGKIDAEKNIFASQMGFKEYSNSTYSFDLTLDGTGASIPSSGIHSGKKGYIPDLIKKFKDVTYEYRGSIHRPAYLRLEWGEASVPMCVLTSLTIKHDVFSSDGTPLRSTLTCTFTEYLTIELAEARAKTASPDMTHIRVVQQGDQLPLMCERIYGDAKLYQQVARHNKLSNYRKLVPGQKLYFPPLIAEKR